MGFFKKKIIFRADGNAATGLGHLYRLFAMVEIVKSEYDYIYLVKESTSLSVIPKTYTTGIIPNTVSIADEPQWLSLHYRPEEYIIIADGYQFNSQYQYKVKDVGYKLIYIDDLITEHMYADIVINHAIGLRPSDFKSASYTQFALGTNYAVLRPAFIKAALNERKLQTINKAFVCFGGADPFNFTSKCVRALSEIGKFDEIHVVLGEAYNHTTDEAVKNEKIKYHRNLNEYELSQLMYNCNFAVVPASTVLYEVCTIKMPVIAGYFIKNQEMIYKGFAKSKAIYQAGNLLNLGANDFEPLVNNALKNGNFELMLNAQKMLFNGNIAENHLNLIKSLC